MRFFLQKYFFIVIAWIICSISSIQAQVSPGDLAKSHAQLEGISNCTQCHSVGKEVTREKCLACHKEIRSEINAHKGFHASKEVGMKNCAVCHSDHHGRNFDMIRLDKKKFNHDLTGFSLKGEHAKQECAACHKPERIKDPVLKKRKGTFLGLSQDCLSCHADYHQGHLSKNCTECHNFTSWKNATGFDHNKTRFPLLGKHRTVQCIDCHKMEIVNGKKYQRFSNLEFANCTACHTDVHKGKFGQDCKRCHTEESWKFSKTMKAFNHDKTDFKLLGKHRQVDCKACHTSGKMTDPLKHDKCEDCHKDFHKGEFKHRDGTKPDCNKCHTNDGFTPSTFSIAEHNKHYKLEGAHLATSCAACHKKGDNQWTFKIRKQCISCHKNEHEGMIEDKFMGDKKDCSICHNVVKWNQIKPFDHAQTGFKLDGKHAVISCAECHYAKSSKGGRMQKFKGLSSDCESCHKEPHAGQFATNGKTSCERCHGTDSWHNSKFNHNTMSRFILDGSHVTVKCEECHKPVSNEKGRYIQYKFNDISCASCHKK